MRKPSVLLRTYYVLPCCLLLLNLANSLISYKAELIGNPLLRTAVVMALVLGGASLVALVLAPGIQRTINTLQRGSRRRGGRLGEVLFLLLLGAGVFWCYYQLSTRGPSALLPIGWRNGVGH